MCPKNKDNPGVRQLPNRLTAFIDASQIYSPDPLVADALRNKTGR